MKLHDVLPPPPHFTIRVLEDCSPPGDGFLRRLSRRVCTVSPEGAESTPLTYDEVDRRALDAVVVIPHFVARSSAGTEQRYVVLRSAIRPPVALRSAERSPLSEAENRNLWEVPAGLVEENERGWSGVRAAALRELAEETGYSVEEAALLELGPTTFPAPGVIAERHFYFEARVDPNEQQPVQLDGPLEEAGELIAVPLAECLRAVRAGQVPDAKTELALRRLHERLSGEAGALT